MIPQHCSKRVDRALVELCDALAQYNHYTGRESVFVLRESDYECRAISGKPVTLPDVADNTLWSNLIGTWKSRWGNLIKGS